jgi:hypothetical protein
MIEIKYCKECGKEFTPSRSSKQLFCCAVCARRNNGKRNLNKKFSAEINEKKSSKGEKNPMFGKSFYEIWLDKYGKEEADKRLESFKNKKRGVKHTESHKNSISKSLTGEKNPFYGKTHSIESKSKISKNHRNCKGDNNPMFDNGHKIKGEKNGAWQGGVSLEDYGEDFDDKLKESIRSRDNYTCVICKNAGCVVHHIDYDKKNNNKNNLITLCNSDHAKTNFNRDSWIEFFKPIIHKLYE